MVSQHTKLLFGASVWVLFASGTFLHGVEGHLSQKNVKSIENPASSDVGLPDNFWEQFLLYEGCFELNGTPEKERNDPQNNNYVCNDFCKNDGKNYSATIGERCLCFSNRPSGLVSADQCKTTCPSPFRFKSRSTEEESCDGINCCGSLPNNTMTVIQAIRIVPHRNLDEKGRHSVHHVTYSRDGFGNFIVHEGCFEITGVNPDESRNDPQNANSVCIDYCVENGITYAATISDRCLCLNSLPSNKLADDQCDAQCPGNIFEEGEACVGFGCCGSEINNAASIYQSVPASRDKDVNK